MKINMKAHRKKFISYKAQDKVRSLTEIQRNVDYKKLHVFKAQPWTPMGSKDIPNVL